MFSKNKKIIILIIGIIVIVILIITGFFVFKKTEKKGLIRTEQKIDLTRKLGESYFLSTEEKEKAGIDSNLEIKAKKVKGDLGIITVIEFPKKK